MCPFKYNRTNKTLHVVERRSVIASRHLSIRLIMWSLICQGPALRCVSWRRSVSILLAVRRLRLSEQTKSRYKKVKDNRSTRAHSCFMWADYLASWEIGRPSDALYSLLARIFSCELRCTLTFVELRSPWNFGMWLGTLVCCMQQSSQTTY